MQRYRWREGQFFEGRCKDTDGGRGSSLRGGAKIQMEGGAVL